jgi:serine-type D-Ala-D-Ala carboxypeptidase/endopeptidase (penicillin-binding protein 4)
MKLFTTYAGLEPAGPDHVWRNRVYTDGPVRDGVLLGNLVVRGSGDPKLVVERLQELLAQVQAQRACARCAATSCSTAACSTCANAASPLTTNPCGPTTWGPTGCCSTSRRWSTSSRPMPPAARCRCALSRLWPAFRAPTQLPLSQAPCSDWRRQLQADFSQPLQVRFAGSYPGRCGEREWPVAYPEPEAYAPRVMQALWLGAGGQLTGQVRYGVRPIGQACCSKRPLCLWPEIIQDINKFSNNVMAQQLYLTLSSELGAPGRFEASRLRLSQWWRKALQDTTSRCWTTARACRAASAARRRL